MATPHIGAEKGQVAKTVLMPGDPLRAKFVAENYLTDVQQYNEVRGMLGFTGLYRGARVSVQGSGMGIPSIAIYSYELFHFFDVENIIRIGTCGAMDPGLFIGNLIFAMGASSDSNFANQFNLPGHISALADYTLLETAVGIARQKGLTFKVGNMASGDVFYKDDPSMYNWGKMGVLGGEMESYALYLNAARARKRALTVCTVSDENHTGKKATPEERQTAFTAMMEVALETALAIEG